MTWKQSIIPLGVVFFLSAAFAQESGSITGQVLDTSMGSVTGAKISIRNQATGVEFATTSDNGGFYRAPQIAPGTYEITVSAGGFRTVVQKDVVVRVNDRLRVDLQLEVGQVSEQVTVQGVAPLLQAEDAIVGQVVDNRKIVDLPLNSRNWLQLANLAPGTVNYPGVVSLDAGNKQNIIMNIGGNRTANTNYLLDGGDNNGQFISGSLTQPPVDSLQEFKVETNNYTADAGRMGGAVVNAVIKSGGNAFHGSAYDFLRNRELNARNFFAAPTGQNPEFTRNQYGASLGGPVMPNHLFFFLNYEGNRQRQNAVTSRQVFTDAQKAGDFSSALGGSLGVDAGGSPVAAGQIYDPFSVRRLANGTAVRDPVPGNRIPTSRLNPASKTLIESVPRPNKSGSPNFVADVSNPLNVDTYVGRMDWTRGKDSIFGHFLYSDQDSNTAPVLGLPADGGDTNLLLSQQRQMAVAWTHIFNPSNLNELRIGYVRSFRFSNTVQLNTDVNGKLGIPFPFQGPGFGGLANIGISGFTTLGSAAGIFSQYLNGYELGDNFTMIRGRHSFKFGFQGLQKVFQNHGACNACRGVLSFNGVFTSQPGFNNTGSPVADFLYGTVNGANYDNVRNVSTVGRDYNFYAQDKWQVNSKLALSLGIRYTHYPPNWVKQGLISSVVWDPGYKSPTVVTGPEISDEKLNFMKNVLLPFIPVVRASDKGLNRSLIKDTPEDFGPRIGIAYRFSNKMVLRAGYGIFYGYPDQSSVGGASNPPNLLSVTRASNTVDPTLIINQPIFAADPFNTALPNPNFVTIRDPNYRYDFVQMYNLMVQRQFGQQWVLEVGFMGNRGSSILILPNLNDARPALPSDTSSPQSRRIVSPLLGNLPYASPQGFSNYNAFIASMEKRYSSGLSLLANYTWSRAFGVAPPLNAGINDVAVQNPLDLKREYGPLEFDIVNRAVFSYSYEFPVGRGKRYLGQAPRVVDAILGNWQVSGITTLQGGFPVTPVLSVSLGKTLTNSRPNAIGDPTKTSRQPNDWLNPGAFTVPTPAEVTAGNFFGNTGRNSVREPGLVNFDFSILKSFVFTERFRVQFRTEFFNLTNTPFFGLPGGLSTNFSTPTFGKITAAGDPRVIQLGAKLIF